MLSEILKERNVPELLSREEMLDIVQAQLFGYLPPKPEKISFETEENTIPKFCAGKAVCHKVTVNTVINGKEFSFPFLATLPTDEEKHPFFVHINFRDLNPDRYMPTEELVDNGFAVLSVWYNDITTDDGDFTNGLAGVLFENGKRNDTDCGKIAMWAWATQRILDYAETLPDKLDLSRSVVCGHSRLGKTALFAGATDERFAFSYSNDSGCSGAAIARGTAPGGERVADICRNFPFWFCENYKKYCNNEDNMPFDQHYLVASIAPRKVLIGSASEDKWADPLSEMLCCVASSPAFVNGFKYEDRPPQIDDKFFDGDIGYHMRKGLHYFSREDWLRLIEFVNLHS
ncbi:MAG: hypothetical protein J6A49_06990 [Clostridia bacterium]|nr:hypothetical protein [Clostridia bacterium]